MNTSQVFTPKYAGQTLSFVPDVPANQLKFASEAKQALYEAQSTATKEFLMVQAKTLTDALIQDAPQVVFQLPEKIVCEVVRKGDGSLVTVPVEARNQSAKGIVDRLFKRKLQVAIVERLSNLERSSDQAIAVSAGLLRYATAHYLVHELFPGQRQVKTSQFDHAFLPEYMAFNDQGQLIVGSLEEAKACIASIQKYLWILQMAVTLAPYILADEVYQQKYHVIIAQLINQGRALTHFEMSHIIHLIKQRSAEGDLNRGLSLSLDYLDERNFEKKTLNFEIIPRGHYLFSVAFVVLAARSEQDRIARDPSLSYPTRQVLLNELKALEQAFQTGSPSFLFSN